MFFSDDNMTIYPLRMADRDCKNTIDLFLYEEDGKFHYSLIKNFSRLIRIVKLLQEQMNQSKFVKDVLVILLRKNY